MSFSVNHFTLTQGDETTRPHRFTLPGRKGPFDLSGASWIRYYINRTDVDRTNFDPIELDRNHPDADWGNGLTITPFGNINVTAEVGTYNGAMRVSIGGQQFFISRDLIEVEDAAGFGTN